MVKDVKALTNKLLKVYLKQKGLKISGSKAKLIDRVLTLARGNLSARDAVEDDESPNSCEGDTSSKSSDSDDSSNDSSTYVCTKGRNQTSKLGMRESMGGDFFQGGGEGSQPRPQSFSLKKWLSLNIIIM